MTVKEQNDATIDKFMVNITNAYIDINKMVSKLSRKYPDQVWSATLIANKNNYKNYIQLWIDKSDQSLINFQENN